MYSFLLDIDNTIYSRKAGLLDALIDKAVQFIITRLNMDESEAVSLSRRFFSQYGAILDGLMFEYDIEPEDFICEVFDIDVCYFLTPNVVLADALSKLNGKKYAFSDSTCEYIKNVLDCLDISSLFSGIYDRRFLKYNSKSNKNSYYIVLDYLSANPDECVLVDDKVANICLAKEIGMNTVWVNEGDTTYLEEADFIIPAIHNIGQITRFTN